MEYLLSPEFLKTLPVSVLTAMITIIVLYDKVIVRFLPPKKTGVEKLVEFLELRLLNNMERIERGQKDISLMKDKILGSHNKINLIPERLKDMEISFNGVVWEAVKELEKELKPEIRTLTNQVMGLECLANKKKVI